MRRGALGGCGGVHSCAVFRSDVSRAKIRGDELFMTLINSVSVTDCIFDLFETLFLQ